MTPYTGANSYPTSVTLPDNADLVSPAAATLNVGPQGALDRATYLHLRLATAPACSWEPQVSVAASCDAAAWNPKLGVWWAVGGGNTDRLNQTNDYGKSWSFTALALDVLACNDVAADLSGNGVIANDASTTLYQFNGTAWAHVLTALLGTVHLPRIRYEATNSLWVAFYNDTTFGERVATSPDRVTWTDRSAALPAGLKIAGTYTSHVGVGGGYAVVASKISGTTITLASCLTTTPGTWTGSTITAAVITTLTDCSDPIYSADDSAWLISLYGTFAGGSATEIWQSTNNGVTWTRVSTIQNSGLKITWLANIGHMFAGLSIDGFIVYSTDVGATWFAAGMHCATASATHLGLWAGGGGLMEIDWGGAAPNSRASSVRLSNLLTPALT